MLAPVGALPAVDPETDGRRNPLVPIPADPSNLVEGLDAALVTHLHRDHFDADAAERLPPDTVIVTQPDARSAHARLQADSHSGPDLWIRARSA